jgi:hypothetical protein
LPVFLSQILEKLKFGRGLGKVGRGLYLIGSGNKCILASSLHSPKLFKKKVFYIKKNKNCTPKNGCIFLKNSIMKKFLKTAWRVGEWENGHFSRIVQKFIDKISLLNFRKKLGGIF